MHSEDHNYGSLKHLNVKLSSHVKLRKSETLTTMSPYERANAKSHCTGIWLGDGRSVCVCVGGGGVEWQGAESGIGQGYFCHGDSIEYQNVSMEK